MPRRRAQPCEVPTCPALAVRGQTFCAAHRQWALDQVRAYLERGVGLVAPLRRVTDRVEYDAEGRPVRFYPETRR